jgi:ABC-type transport system involved in multi-copper enzyme maturation permease subunit
MLGHIIRKEILSNLSSPTFLGTFILCSCLILLSIYTGLRSFSDQVEEYQLTETLNRQDLSEMTSYSALSYQGVQLSKPPEVLSTVVSGIENSMGRHTHVSVTNIPGLTGSKIEGNPIFAVFGDLDLMFVVKTVLSLLAVLFTYNAISGEKEDGTLRLTLSHAVPRDTLILGKMIGGFLCLAIPLSIPLTLGIALLTLFPKVHLTGGDWVRLGLILGVFLLYLALFFTLGMFVSARTSRSNISFLVLLFIWAVFVLVIPKGSVIVASQFVQVPSIQEHRTRKAQARRDLWAKYSPKMRDLFINNPAPRPPRMEPNAPKEKQDAAIAEHRQALAAWQEKRRAAQNELDKQRQAEWEIEQARMEQGYQNKQQRLAGLAIGLSRISPASALTYASMGLADTGIESQDHFLALARAYKEKFAAYAYLKFQEEQRQRDEAMRSQRPMTSRAGVTYLPDIQQKPIAVKDMPMFQHQKEPLSDALGRITVDLALMALLTVAFFAGAYVSFLKYDVR